MRRGNTEDIEPVRCNGNDARLDALVGRRPTRPNARLRSSLVEIGRADGGSHTRQRVERGEHAPSEHIIVDPRPMHPVRLPERRDAAEVEARIGRSQVVQGSHEQQRADA